MAKRIVFNPLILLGDTPGDDTVIGGGTGQGGVNPIGAAPCNFSFWVNNYATSEWDATGDGYDYYDFGDWWRAQGFSESDWNELNPGYDFYEYVNP